MKTTAHTTAPSKAKKTTRPQDQATTTRPQDQATTTRPQDHTTAIYQAHKQKNKIHLSDEYNKGGESKK